MRIILERALLVFIIREVDLTKESLGFGGEKRAGDICTCT